MACKRKLIFGVLCLVLFRTGMARATELEALHCQKSAAFLAPIDSPDHRKYAPDREVDILHLAIDVTPDFKRRTVAGTTTIRFKPIASPLDELRLDAVDLAVATLTCSEPVRAYQVTAAQIIVTFEKPIPAGQEATVTIAHAAEPREGLYFRTPEMGYKEGETHLFTQGEAIEARHWYPCYDYPNEKFTSEVTCRVPEAMVVLSNGRLVSESRDPDTGLKVVRWLQDKPHVNYLISLVAGHFEKIEDRYRDIPMAFWTLPSEIAQAPHSFRNTKDMMAFFEEEIGVPYPWVKYDQVCVNDFVAGGMENTTLTTLTDRTLFSSASENIHSSDDLVAHELVHQWFGNLVTCKDWSHLWLNEGFATYYAHLYDGHKHGRDSMLYGLYRDAQGFINRADDTKPIVDRRYDSAGERFSYLTYPKASWVLHMLREELGPELFRRCVKTYLDRHQFDTVVTEDLNEIIEEMSGRSFDQFFDQWVYHAHHPELEVSYSWDAKTSLAKLSIAQVQKVSAEVLLFRFPLAVRFIGESESTDHVVTVKEKSEDFYFALPEAPRIVRVDPNHALLAKLKFNLPDAMLHAQLTNNQDAIGRVLAVEQLAGKKDRSSVAKLGEALQHDAFYGVRIEAAKALRAIHTDEAFSALTNSLAQPDARVRRQVVISLASFYREEAYHLARHIIREENNPDIVASAVDSLGKYAEPATAEILQRLLRTDSYRNRLADAAIDSMRAQDNPAFISAILEVVRQREGSFTSMGLGRALSALGRLARNEKNKDEVRNLLLKFAQHSKKTVQRAAIAALGTLGDAKAIPILETFAGASKDTPEQRAAEQALSALRAARPVADELKDLRNEVLGLKKLNQDLTKQMDDLRKKFDARVQPTNAPPKTKAQPKKPPIRRGQR